MTHTSFARASRRPRRALPVIMLAAVLAACGGGGGDGPGTGPAATTGRLTLKLTDSPIDQAAAVVVVFTGVELQRADGTRTTLALPAPRSIDLLQLQDGRTVNLLDDVGIEAGRYQWLRLLITAEQNNQSGSYIQMLDGQRYPLYIPSGAENGLRLVRPFNVAQGSITRLVVDFDLRKSVHAPPGRAPNWFLRPTLRLMDELQVGTLTATVDLAALASAQATTLEACVPGLYLFTGAGQTPDDMDGSATDGADPLLYRPLPRDPGVTSVSATVPFVEAGAYTVAATCDYDVDVAADASEYDPTAAAPAEGQPPPAGYQTMKWSKVDATVTAGTTTTVRLPPPVPAT